MFFVYLIGFVRHVTLNVGENGLVFFHLDAAARPQRLLAVVHRTQPHRHCDGTTALLTHFFESRIEIYSLIFHFQVNNVRRGCTPRFDFFRKNLGLMVPWSTEYSCKK